MKPLLPFLVGSSLAVTNAAVLADDNAALLLPISIEGQPMRDALNAWATQTGYKLGMEFGEPLFAPKVAGVFTPQAALERLLEGTSLKYQWLNEQQVKITGPDWLEEVIVTGTHIRGEMHSAAPFIAHRRSRIDATTALGSMQTLMESQPQNFAGGASQNAIQSGADNTNNRIGGEGFNLRGLGTDATLVLLNGQPIARGNVNGNFVDMAMIPLSAVDRIEIVPDGASAIYGSDAVGGVVNVILRRKFHGAETRAGHGFVADGDSSETQIAQTLGYQSDVRSVLASYEYFSRSPLSTEDRRYARDVQEPVTLLPQQARSSFFLSAEQELSPTVSLFADGLYSQRESRSDITPCTCEHPLRLPSRIDAYTATVGARIDLPLELNLELTLSDSVSNTHQQTWRDAELVTDNRVSSSIRSMEARLDGSLWSTTAGAVRHALGIVLREETFDTVDPFSSTAFHPRRRLMAGYLDLRIPLIGPAAGALHPQLELSVSGRGERYSDFGSTFNPRIGAVWTPVETLRVRGTYGTAFKAPLLNDLNPRPRFPVAVAVADPLTGGVTPTLFVFGGNPELEPERATTWTAGFDWQPAAGWKIGATYYDIQITDRIVDPLTFVNPGDALAHESILGPTVVQRAPPSHTVNALTANPEFVDFSGDPAGIAALVDSRLHNLAAVDTRGVDLSASFSAKLDFATIEAGIDATYIIGLDTRLANAAASVELLNTPYNPADTKARARFSLRRGGVELAAYLNYIGSYVDARSGVAVPVSSWATADVTLGFQTRSGNGLLSDTSVMVGIRNVAGEDPPFVKNLGAVPIHFDGANANPLGRFYSVQFLKRW